MLFKNTTDARRAPIPVKTSPTFSIPRLVYRRVGVSPDALQRVRVKRYLSCIVHYYGWQISKITFGNNAKYYILIGFF